MLKIKVQLSSLKAAEKLEIKMEKKSCPPLSGVLLKG